MILSSCSKDLADTSIIVEDSLTSGYPESTTFEVSIDGKKQEIKLFRVRKANGASRMRILVEMSDSTHFSLFLTPFTLGSQKIETGNVSEEIFKFSRTHCELKKYVNESQYYLFEVDSAFASENKVEITHLDTIQKTVEGWYKCNLKTVAAYPEVKNQKILINGVFFTTYRD